MVGLLSLPRLAKLHFNWQAKALKVDL
jgi:hypothetical protein